MKRRTLENQAKKAIMELLALYPRKVFAWRQNTGGAYYGKQYVKYSITGAADITGLLSNGQRLEIEVKSPTGTQSDAQIAFQEVIERMGGVYILARSAGDVLEALEGIL